jgi:hypothetical protein
MAETAKFNPLLWVVALAIINGAWYGVAGGEAKHEINDQQHSTEDRTIEISSVFGLDKEISATFSVEFFKVSADSGNASWKITDEKGQLIAQWRGSVGQEPGWEGQLSPGTYTINTTMDEGFLTEQNLYIKPFENLRLEGHLLLSIGLIVFAFMEPIVKNNIAKIVPKQHPQSPKSKKNPFKSNDGGMPENDQFHDDDDPWRSPTNE